MTLVALAPNAGWSRGAEGDVPALIADAVRARMGTDAAITIAELTVSLPAGVVATAARPETGARLGRAARFALLAGDREMGHAVATCRAVLPHARAAAAIPAGHTLSAADILTVTDDPGGVLVGSLPGAGMLIGSTSLRAVAAGETLTAGLVRAGYAVRSGERIQVSARVEAVVAHVMATAQQSGRPGDVVRAVTDARRPLRVRITGKGEGEVVHDR